MNNRKVFKFSSLDVTLILKKKFKAIECTEDEKIKLLYANPFNAEKRLAYKITDVDLLDSLRTENEKIQNKEIRTEYEVECQEDGVQPIEEFIIVIIDYDEKDMITWSVLTHHGQTSSPQYLQDELKIFRGNDYTSWADYEYLYKNNPIMLEETIKNLDKEYMKLIKLHGY